MAGLTKAQRAEKKAKEAQQNSQAATPLPATTETPVLSGEAQKEQQQLNTPLATEVVEDSRPKVTGNAKDSVANSAAIAGKTMVTLRNKLTGVSQEVPASTADRLMSRDKKGIFSIE